MSDDLGGAVLAGQARRSATDWRAAIRLAGAPLVDAGVVTDGYVERCIALAGENDAYIVLAPGIALAHARPEDGVERVGVAVVTLTDPVEFGHRDNDPVDVVFAFGSPDAEQHVGLLSALATALLAGLADRLREAPDDEAIEALLQELVDDR